MKRSLLENFLRLFVICAIVTVPLSIGCGGVESEPVGVDAPEDVENEMEDTDMDLEPQ